LLGSCRALLILIFAAGGVSGSGPSLHAQDRPASEYEVKAALLYNFARFVEWPAQTFPQGKDLVAFCIVSDILLDQPFDVLKDKTLGGRRLEIKHFQNPKALESCHVLFVVSSRQEPVDQILKKLDGSSVLTIGETEGFIQMGGIINIKVEDSKLRFEINRANAERAGLKISSRLLALATTVTDRSP